MPVTAPPRPPSTTHALEALREEALIKEARERARRRRQRYAAALATATAVIAVGAAFAMRPDKGGAQPSAAARPLAPVSSSATRSIIMFGAWYIVGDNLTGRLYTINPDGTGRQQLLRRTLARVADHSASSPTLSPDGRKIAFQTGRAGNRPAIVVINRDGTGLHQIAPLGEHPVWSPDGTKIAFSIWRNTKQKPYYTRRIYVVRADGTNQHRLKPSGLYPAWSPDGSKIAYACGPLRGRYDASLCVMKANGTGQHRIARIGSLGTPAWSPDGSKIAFYSGNEWLYVINANATHLRQLKAVSSLFECTPAWSPNGKRIAFSNTNGGPWLITNGIFLIDADGRNIVHLKGTTGGCGIHWQRTH